MNGAEALRRWAPPGAPWSAWVKPVLFAHFDEFKLESRSVDASPPRWLEADLLEPLAAEGPPEGQGHPYRHSRGAPDVALIIDLPGASGALAGVALAQHGFQPVPLYNALPASASMVIDQRPVMRVLLGAVDDLPSPPDDARPAFLLDARRMGADSEPLPGSFDNRSVCFTTDFPSAAKLVEAGVRRAVLVQEKGARPAIDVGDTLHLWAKGGIEIFVKQTSVRGPPVRCPDPRASLFSRAVHWFGKFQLGRQPDGSYGTRLPTIHDEGSGGGG